MYALIVVIAVLGGTVTPVGVGSQVVGKFRESRSVQSGCESTQRRGRYLRSEFSQEESIGTAFTQAGNEFFNLGGLTSAMPCSPMSRRTCKSA